MSDPNETRRLAPDTKWILQVGGTVIGTALAAVVAVTQYQLNTLREEQIRAMNKIQHTIEQTADLTLERARGIVVTREEIDTAFRTRDALIAELQRDMVKMREVRAKTQQQLKSASDSLDRIVSVTIETQRRAAETEGRLRELLKQSETNTTLLGRIVDQQVAAAQALSERLTRLEAGGVVGVP